MRALSILTLVAPLLLAGCGDDRYDSARAVAEALGCEQVEESSVSGADEAVTCTIEDSAYRIAWFTNDQGVSRYRAFAEMVWDEAADELGEVDEESSGIVIGENWAVECADTSCDEVVDLLGGEKLQRPEALARQNG